MEGRWGLCKETHLRHSDESNLLLKDLEYETCETQLSSNMGFQRSGNHQMRPSSHEDLTLKFRKLQQEAGHLHDLLAQEEVHSCVLQEEITEQNKRQLSGERYFQRKRISRKIDVRGPKDLHVCRCEFHNCRRWMDRRQVFTPAPVLNRKPSCRRCYHRGPPDTGWRHGHISCGMFPS